MKTPSISGITPLKIGWGTNYYLFHFVINKLCYNYIKFHLINTLKLKTSREYFMIDTNFNFISNNKK
jgi:hypothetical protein